MIPNYYLDDNTEMHIGGFDICTSEDNSNIGCVLMLYQAYRKHNNGAPLLVGKCVFCQRIFPVIDWEEKKIDHIIAQINRIISNATYWKFIFHPMINDYEHVKETYITDRIYKVFPGEHAIDNENHNITHRLCNIRNEKYLWDSYVAIRAKNYMTVIPCKECPGCGSHFLQPNVQLGIEYNKMMKFVNKTQSDNVYDNINYWTIKQNKTQRDTSLKDKKWHKNKQVKDTEFSPSINTQIILDKARVKGYIEAKNVADIDFKLIEDIPILLSKKTLLVRATTTKCTSKNHTMKDVICLVNVTNGYETVPVQVPAVYCSDCNKYYILENHFNELVRKGRILCKVMYNNRYYYYDDYYDFDFNDESILKMMGYSVSERDGPTTERRREILQKAVDYHIMTRNEICSHLNNMIKLRLNNPYMSDAIDKWEADIEYISNYEPDDLEKIEAAIIIKDLYHYR